MGAPIIPWMPSQIPGEIQDELNRRKVNRSFKFTGNSPENWNKDGDWNSYRGPMTSWIRVCSNGMGKPNSNGEFDKQRFVFYSGKGFYNTYGFGNPKNAGSSREQIIGYVPELDNGYEGSSPSEPHIIENSLIVPSGESSNYPIHVPTPEISRLEVTVQKELFRRVQIEWVCFSRKQLDYMASYFLVPGITCMVEWGWNHYNPESLVDLSDISEMRKLWDNAYPLYTNNIIKSRGNYDVVYGIISNFNWSIEGNKIICTTEVTSKDRLYAGISKEYGLSKPSGKQNADDGIIKGILDFIRISDTTKNLKTLVSSAPVVNANILSLSTSDPKTAAWFDILNPLLTPSANVTDTKLASEQIGMRYPHIFGVFSGRPTDSYYEKEEFWTPLKGDFDEKIQDTDAAKYFWINMGMVVAILNHFSKRENGTKHGTNAFEVDIQNSVIGGHPNLVSCDSRVLIPNYQAPKFLYGNIGTQDNVKDAQGIYDSESGGKKQAYAYQSRQQLPLGDSSSNKKLAKICYQGGGCYRDDLDGIINYNRYRYIKLSPGETKNVLNSYSFPSKIDAILPESPRGLPGDKLKKDISGLLSNVYISFDAFKNIIEDPENHTYVDIYNGIFKLLGNATDGFWDLGFPSSDGVLTINDKNYISEYALNEQKDKVYSFDYSDSDSIIKSIKFRPVLSDVQATRVMYGSTNNKTATYQVIDKNDILNFKYRDAVIGTPEDKSQGDGNRARVDSAILEQRDLLRTFQRINSNSDDGCLQMALNPRRGVRKAPDGSPTDYGFREYVKLALGAAGGQQILRLLLADDDYKNNQRYCAAQPGITLELTLQGIGGLRTFQYFLIKNFPEPYSDTDIIFRITDVHQTLEAGNWETTVRAQLHPLRDYIKNRVKGPYDDGKVKTQNGWLITPDTKV